METIPANWYVKAFGADYPDRYDRRNETLAAQEITWVMAQLSLKKGDRLLDVCCGQGRHLKALQGRGFDVHGFDLSHALLSQASGRRVQADQRVWPYRSNCFAACLVMFTSLGYFVNDDDNFALLSEMQRCLKEDGQFLVDVPDPADVKENLIPESTRQLDKGYLKEFRWFEGERVCKKIEWKTTEGQHEYFESVRLYSFQELSAAFQNCGLQIQKVFPGIPPETGRQVFLGVKA